MSLAFAPECCHPLEDGLRNDISRDKGSPRGCISNDDAYSLSAEKTILGVTVDDKSGLGGSRQVPSQRRQGLEQ